MPKDVAYKNCAELFVCERQIEDVSGYDTRGALAGYWVNIGAYIAQPMRLQPERPAENTIAIRAAYH